MSKQTDDNAPRYAFVRRPITTEEAMELKMERIREAAEQLRLEIESELETEVSEYIEVKKGTPEWDRADFGTLICSEDVMQLLAEGGAKQ